MERVTIDIRKTRDEKDCVLKHIKIKDHTNTGDSEDIIATIKIKEAYVKRQKITNIQEFKSNLYELHLRLPFLDDLFAIDIINRAGDGEDINSIAIDERDIEYRTIAVYPGDLMWDFWASKAYDEITSIIG